MDEVKFAIVGCGHIAHKHAQAIRALDGVKLAAVCDPNEDRVKKFVEEYQGEGYLNYGELLKRQDIQVINLCTPSGLHGEMALAAARARKHVLLEKPMTLSLQEADDLIEGCRANGVHLGVIHQNRFKPAVQYLKEAVEKGRFGKLTHGNATVRWNRGDQYFQQEPWRGTRKMDGGTFLNQAIHNIDLLLWIMGPVKSVFAYTATRLRSIETEDVGVALLRFANGALGVVEAATTIYPGNLEETLNIFGSTGTVILGGVTANEARVWEVKDLSKPEGMIDKLPSYQGHLEAIKDMVKAVQTGTKPLVDGEEARNTLEVILAIYESAATGQEVILPFREV